MIPRKLAYRIWQACCAEQARQLAAKAGSAGISASARRRGGSAVEGAAAKSAGRSDRADQLTDCAAVFGQWIAAGGPAGGDLDPELVALVCCYLYRHGSAGADIGRWAMRHGRQMAELPTEPGDVLGLIEWLISAP